MKIGDMVQMKRRVYGNLPGLVLEIVETKPHTAIWVKVLWSNGGDFGLEKARDLEVISESR